MAHGEILISANCQTPHKWDLCGVFCGIPSYEHLEFTANRGERMSIEHSPTRHSAIAVSPTRAASLAGIGRTKLYEAIASGALPSFKIGTRRLIRVSALEAWLTSLEGQAT